MRRTFWYLVAALLMLAGCLVGCVGAYMPGDGSGGAGGSGASGGGAGANGGSGGGAQTPVGTPTYYRDVLPVFQKDCLSCHARGGAAQPVLDDAASAAAAASTIAAAIQSKTMPPFPPADGCNHYVGERRMSAVDQQVVAQWVAAGAPSGDAASAPAPTTSGGGVALGAADKHLVAGPFTPTYPGSAGANDLYWCFVLDPQLGAASDLTAMNIVPGQKDEVHHVIIFRDPGGQGSTGKPAGGYECNGAPGEMLSGWVPGSGPLQLPAGVGMTISPTDKLLMQVHYHRDPAKPAAADSTALDLYFSPATTAEHAWVVWAGTPLFTIPANTTGYAVSSTCTVNGNWKLLGVAPHMHQHATKFASNIQAATNQCLMNIPRWDFGWQGGYFLEQPVTLKPGDKVTTSCTYDNPTASQIKFGEATTDEMCFGFLYVVAPAKPTFSGLVNIFGGQNAASMCAN